MRVPRAVGEADVLVVEVVVASTAEMTFGVRDAPTAEMAVLLRVGTRAG